MVIAVRSCTIPAIFELIPEWYLAVLLYVMASVNWKVIKIYAGIDCCVWTDFSFRMDASVNRVVFWSPEVYFHIKMVIMRDFI